MRRTSSGSRWISSGHRYAGGWRQNPWINAVSNTLQARSEAGNGSSASIDIDPAADRHVGNQEQKAAVRTWENEGGSLAPHVT